MQATVEVRRTRLGWLCKDKAACLRRQADRRVDELVEHANADLDGWLTGEFSAIAPRLGGDDDD